MENDKMYFYTASILNWETILYNNKLKDIIIDSLIYLTEAKAVKLYAFVLMPNHIHLILKPLNNSIIKNFQLSFMRFTAQKIKFYLLENEPETLYKLIVHKKDRLYQIWQRNPLAIELYTKRVFEQKLRYIHNNPLNGKWSLAEDLNDYKYSSVRFYETNSSDWPFLSNGFEDF